MIRLRRLRSGRSRRACRAGQLVSRRGSCGRRRRAWRASASRPVYDETVVRQGSVRGRLGRNARAARFSTPGQDPSIAALIAMRGGYGSAQLLPLLDPDVLTLGAQGVDRLQRHHGDPDAVPAARPDRDSRTDDRSAAVERAVGLRRGFVSQGADVEPSPPATCAPPQLEALHEATATGTLVGGTLTQLWRRWARRGPSSRRTAACCFSKTSASARIAFIAC